MAQQNEITFDTFDVPMSDIDDSVLNSPLVIQAADPVQLQTFDFDQFLVEHIEEMDGFLRDSKVNLRTLTRKDGVLTLKGSDDFVEKFNLDGLPNGARKRKIKQLLQRHPSLASTNPQTMWRRIDYYIKKYPLD